MARQVFALVIGINHYQFQNIWSLSSASADARGIAKWLVEHLQIPTEHVHVLLNKEASRQNIVHAFQEHLLENPDVSRDDSILSFFAGYGSRVRALSGDKSRNRNGEVPVLCPCDFDTKTENGGVNVGISAPSLHAMLDALAAVKGMNITVVLGASFALKRDLTRGPTCYVRYTPARQLPPKTLRPATYSHPTPRCMSARSSRGFGWRVPAAGIPFLRRARGEQ